MKLIGRIEEQAILQECYQSAQAEFLAIFGRRQIGKTFLVKHFFENKKCFFFAITGIQKGKISDQINRFMIEIARVFYQNARLQTKKIGSMRLISFSIQLINLLLKSKK